MADRFEQRYSASTDRAREGAVIDEGLRSFMLRVYNYMASGVLLTGIVAYVTANTPALLQVVHGTPLRWVVMLAPIGFVFFLSARINKMSAAAAQATFWAFAVIMGLALSYIFIAYTGASITRTFFVTAGAFAGLSLFGYTTKKDLRPIGTFLVMGLIGLILAMVVNLFLGSPGLEFAISVIGVLIFAGLTAWDTQRIKNSYARADGSEIAGKKAILGATSLYLDFINMFLFLLRFMGER